MKDVEMIQEIKILHAKISQLTKELELLSLKLEDNEKSKAVIKDGVRANNSGILVSYNGVEKTLGEWSEIIGIEYMVLYQRLKSGWTVERAFTAKKRKRNRVNNNWISQV